MGNLRSMIAQEAKAFCCIGPRRRADSKWRSQNKWIEIFRRRRIATRKLSHLLWRFSNHVCAAGVSTLQSIVHTWQMKVVHQHNLASSIRSWISATSGREIVVRIGRDGSCWETSAYVSVSTSSPSAHLFFILLDAIVWNEISYDSSGLKKYYRGCIRAIRHPLCFGALVQTIPWCRVSISVPFNHIIYDGIDNVNRTVEVFFFQFYLLDHNVSFAMILQHFPPPPLCFFFEIQRGIR